MKLNNKKGVSLVEIMVTTIIFTFMMGTLYASLMAGSMSWQAYDSNVQAQQEVRRAIDLMAKDLRVAENVILTQTSGNVSLAFSQSGIGAISYAWANTGGDANRIIRTSPTSTKIIAQHISTFSVTNGANDIVVDVTADVPVAQGDVDNFQLAAKVAKRQ